MRHPPTRLALPALILLGAALTLPWTGRRVEPGPVPPHRVAQVTLDGAEWLRLDSRTNAYTESTQYDASVKIAPDGSARVAWRSRRQRDQRDGVYTRICGADGRLAGRETALDTPAGIQHGAPVALRSGGVEWTAWQSDGRDGRSRATLRPAAGPAIDLGPGARGIALAARHDGGVVAAWLAADRAWSRTFDRAGRPTADAVDLGPAAGVTVASDTAGAVVAWHRPEGGVLAQRIDRRGRAVAGPARIDDIPGAAAIEPSIATGPAGLAVAWMSRPAGAGAYAVRLRSLARDLRAETASTIVSADAAWNSGAGVACLPDGRVAVVWNEEALDSSASRVTLRVVSARGRPGAPLTIGAGRVRASAVDAGRDGRIAVAWSGDAGLGDRSGVHLTLLVPAPAAGIARDAAPPSDRPAPSHEFDPAAFAGECRAARFVTEPAAAMPHDPPSPPGTAPATGGAGNGGPVTAMSGDYGFPGLSIGFPKGTPPDPHMAVGPRHVVGIVNYGMAFWNKSGLPSFLTAIRGPTGFWAGVGANGNIFDPEVHWDPHANRFVALACERVGGSRSMFLLAISDDDDPNGTWHKYRVDVSASAGGDIDSPNLGIDDKAYYLTGDAIGNPRRFAVYIMEKKPLLSGQPPGIARVLTTPRLSAGIPVMWGTAPAMYLIQDDPSMASVLLYAIRDPLGSPQVNVASLPVAPYTQPGPITQRGTTTLIGIFSVRFWSCTWRNGSLWAVHHQGSPVKSRWYEIATNGWPTGGSPSLVQWGDVQAKPTNHASYNSIAVDESGNALMVFTDCGPNDFPGVARCWRAATDPKGTMRPAVVVQANTAPFLGLRWGDYSAAAADPGAANTIWYTHELSPNSPTDWATWIGRKKTAILGTDVPTISASAGGAVTFSLDNPANKNEDYVLILGLSGTAPGFRIGNVQVPLNVDPFTTEALLLALAGNPAFAGFVGKLDQDGNATARMTLPPLPALQGRTVSFTFVQNPVTGWTYASPPVEVRFVQ